ncbi:hypothetical protein A1Q2_01095 [Trichosporon asahii var. asahii CBS 8904]|uniref:Uncharacterized protein n=1 Tax=Trichosporon asahii var. asahii (strain CBS 8904) TaxID=1220162 RepID=K1VYH5_TRIAC|nr:hypothetical protein A1Q2_01095 [Trichosporon asahii var. asahii CBS 8904]
MDTTSTEATSSVPQPESQDPALRKRPRGPELSPPKHSGAKAPPPKTNVAPDARAVRNASAKGQRGLPPPSTGQARHRRPVDVISAKPANPKQPLQPADGSSTSRFPANIRSLTGPLAPGAARRHPLFKEPPRRRAGDRRTTSALSQAITRSSARSDSSATRRSFRDEALKIVERNEKEAENLELQIFLSLMRGACWSEGQRSFCSNIIDRVVRDGIERSKMRYYSTYVTSAGPARVVVQLTNEREKPLDERRANLAKTSSFKQRALCVCLTLITQDMNIAAAQTTPSTSPPIARARCAAVQAFSPTNARPVDSANLNPNLIDLETSREPLQSAASNLPDARHFRQLEIKVARFEKVSHNKVIPIERLEARLAH